VGFNKYKRRKGRSFVQRIEKTRYIEFSDFASTEHMFSFGLGVFMYIQCNEDVLGQDLTQGFIPRTTFVINKEGKIIAVFSSATDHISPADHVEKSLAIVQSL
jgi:hypothetical protein